MLPKYLLIAYKESSDDYCKGCHMASYPSDLKIHESENPEEITKILAHLWADDLRCNETGYEDITLYSATSEESELIKFNARQLTNEIIHKKALDRREQEKRDQAEYKQKEFN